MAYVIKVKKQTVRGNPVEGYWQNPGNFFVPQPVANFTTNLLEASGFNSKKFADQKANQLREYLKGVRVINLG